MIQKSSSQQACRYVGYAFSLYHYVSSSWQKERACTANLGSIKKHQEVVLKVNYSYSVVAESTPSSPCSNVPIHCPVCPKSGPAIWKYFMKSDFKEKHRTLLTKHEHLWKISNFERAEMKKIWAKQGKVTAKHNKKSKASPLIISEKHCVQIPLMYHRFLWPSNM